ncbi:ABC transporter permease [Nitratireductor sp. GCM10026969]|uniref:ABC transporter permease n=1 Tax=Nitratireductor sp. GCM10026969 TaxID=3252645 RepID=UPI00361C4A29
MVFGALRQARGRSGQDDTDRPRINLAENGEGVLDCRLAGNWTTRTVGDVDRQVRDLLKREGVKVLRVNLSDVNQLDTAGAWLIGRLIADQQHRGAVTEVSGETEAAKVLLAAVEPVAEEPEPPAEERRRFLIVRILANLGRSVYDIRDDILYGLNILGATISGAQMKLGRKHAVNPAAITSQIDRMGVGAIPIIVLMSAIVGAIIAQQGAFQLRYFGAEIFVVDLVGILVMRELGVLMTAIMIAGRSGSAITAEIGSMKMREEVDALTVIGLNPIGVLVFPRLVALVIAVPCLTIIANFAALGGAMGVAWLYSGIAPAAFIDRLRGAIDLTSVFAGLIKAPFMAMIIGIIASVEGMKVGGSAESLGTHVTASVVKAIFIVIVVDGVFAIFYAAIDF